MCVDTSYIGKVVRDVVSVIANAGKANSGRVSTGTREYVPHEVAIYVDYCASHGIKAMIPLYAWCTPVDVHVCSSVTKSPVVCSVDHPCLVLEDDWCPSSPNLTMKTKAISEGEWATDSSREATVVCGPEKDMHPE